MAKKINPEDIVSKELKDAAEKVRKTATILEKAVKDFDEANNKLQKLLKQ